MGDRDDAYWARFLGIEPLDWGDPGVSFRAHVGLSGYQGVWCFRHNDRVVVSAPPAWLPHLQDLWVGWAILDLWRRRGAHVIGSHPQTATTA